MARLQFRFLTGDVNWLDYGGKWYARHGADHWFVIELTNMDDACGRDNEGRDKYVVELSEVNIRLSDKDAAGVAQSMGLDWSAAPDLHKVEACHGYGRKAPLGSWQGNNYRQLMRSARAEANALTADTQAYDAAMAKPVNALGSTAAEYQAGDFISAMARGVADNNPAARIMAKMHGVRSDADMESLAELGRCLKEGGE